MHAKGAAVDDLVVRGGGWSQVGKVVGFWYNWNMVQVWVGVEVRGRRGGEGKTWRWKVPMVLLFPVSPPLFSQ